MNDFLFRTYNHQESKILIAHFCLHETESSMAVTKPNEIMQGHSSRLAPASYNSCREQQIAFSVFFGQCAAQFKHLIA